MKVTAARISFWIKTPKGRVASYTLSGGSHCLLQRPLPFSPPTQNLSFKQDQAKEGAKDFLTLKLQSRREDFRWSQVLHEYKVLLLLLSISLFILSMLENITQKKEIKVENKQNFYPNLVYRTNFPLGFLPHTN